MCCPATALLPPQSKAMKTATESEYVRYGELFRLVQEARAQLGLPPYKNRSSLGYALVHNRIPTVQTRRRGKLYHAPTALRILCPGACEPVGECPAAAGEKWVPLGEVYRHANELRLQLGLRPLLRAATGLNTLKRKGVPRRQYGPRNYYYHLPSALRALTRCENPGSFAPIHREGTAEDLASGEYMPLPECARMLRCAPVRLHQSAAGLYIRAFRHPVTNRVWVHIKDAEGVAYYRTASFIFRYMPEANAHYLMRTRPCKLRYWDGLTVRYYYVPELSHLGADTTCVSILQS